jgi:hypothetical protein
MKKAYRIFVGKSRGGRNLTGLSVQLSLKKQNAKMCDVFIRLRTEFRGGVGINKRR